jgi:beta-glucosidase
LYPFGFGLSYTKFEYSGLQVDRETAGGRDTLQVSVAIRNGGKHDGDEVVQLYVKDLTSTGPQPVRSLKGFKRVHVRKGESKDIVISVPVESFRYFDEKNSDFVVEPGAYELEVGPASNDIKVKKTVTILQQE